MTTRKGRTIWQILTGQKCQDVVELPNFLKLKIDDYLSLDIPEFNCYAWRCRYRRVWHQEKHVIVDYKISNGLDTLLLWLTEAPNRQEFPYDILLLKPRFEIGWLEDGQNIVRALTDPVSFIVDDKEEYWRVNVKKPILSRVYTFLGNTDTPESRPATLFDFFRIIKDDQGRAFNEYFFAQISGHLLPCTENKDFPWRIEGGSRTISMWSGWHLDPKKILAYS